MAEADAGARHELNRLTTESEQVQREQADYGMAIEQANKKLESLQEQLTREEQDVLKGRIRDLVNQRVQAGQQIESLVTNKLVPLLERVKEQTNDISASFRQLGTDRNVKVSLGFVSTFLLCNAGKALAPGTGIAAEPNFINRTIEELDQEYFDRILENL